MNPKNSREREYDRQRTEIEEDIEKLQTALITVGTVKSIDVKSLVVSINEQLKERRIALIDLRYPFY